MVAVGLNSARSLPFHGGGRLNKAQVMRAAARLHAAPPDVVRIVVTHHPFDLPKGRGDKDLIGRSGMAMTELAAVGADLFLAGHLHLSHIGVTAERYRIAGHSALVVQAGTLSTRGRGEASSFNVLRLSRPDISVDRYTWDEERQDFRVSSTSRFRRTPTGWQAQPETSDFPLR
jgi:3',5'-cyclic AMP phosphodiesterase CpdA